jgi:TonB-linked SusC/RagA family outer membrane protein
MKRNYLSTGVRCKEAARYQIPRTMKITACLLLIACISFAGNVTSQNARVTLNKSRAPLAEILEEIEQQTDYLFVSNVEINLAEPASVKAKNKPVREVLNQLLEGTDMGYVSEGVNIILTRTSSASGSQSPASGAASQQQRRVSGTVTDAAGEPVPGANVVEKGTTNGSITDIDGGFSLQVSPGATLVISYVGYVAQEIVTGESGVVNVRLLEDSKLIDEVVVVGYGTQKAATITGSVSAVNGDKLTIAPTINYSNALAGRLPGLVAVTSSGEPGSDNARFRIRGVNTLGDNSPLVVVDGVPNRSMERLTADDIESISVLKDASAAIYGAQAANGVILITTKRGNIGKAEVTVTYNEGLSQPTILPKPTDAATYLTMLNEINMYAGQALNYTDEEIEKFRIGGDPWRYPNTDWFGETFKTFASQRKMNAAVRGGAENFRYYVSVGGNFQDAIYKNSATYYSQTNFRGNIDGKLNNYIRIGFDISGRRESQNYPTVSAGSIFGMLMRGKPNMPAYWPNGKPGPDIEYGYNPVAVTTQLTGYDRTNNYIMETRANVDIVIPWIKGLSLSANYSFDKTFIEKKRWRTPWYLYSWDGVSFDDKGEPLLAEGKKGYSSPELWQRNETKGRTTINALLTYERSFGSHNTKVLVGVERAEGNEAGLEAERKYYVSTALDELFAGGDLDKTNTGNSAISKRQNFFGRINYDYDSKYILEFLWRVDGSYIFPADKRYGFFPGISAGWRISEEGFWQKAIPFINYMKLRASWGQTGNDRIAPYQFLSSYGFLTGNADTYVFNLNTQNKILQELRIPNPNVTWEVANQANIGFDGQILDGKLTFSAEYFNNVRSNILWMRNASVPTSTGLTLPRENIGEVSNRGLEFQLGYSDNVRDFSYSASVNGGYSKNKIDYWDETPGIPDYQKTTGYPMPIDLNNEINTGNALYYRAIGIFKDAEHIKSYPHWANAKPGDVIFEDVNGDGEINGLDRVRIDKTVIPTFTGGMNIDLGYKNFYAVIFFQWATGAMRYRYYEMQGESGNYLQSDADGRWLPDKPSATKARTWNRYGEYWRSQRNTYWVQNNDYLRLKNLEIGYNVPRTTTDKLGSKKV